jgi:hypothetical protein
METIGENKILYFRTNNKKMNKYYLIFFGVAVFLLQACSNEKISEKNTFADSLIAVNKDLIKQLNERDELIQFIHDWL